MYFSLLTPVLVFFLITVTKYLRQDNLRKKEFILVYSFRGFSPRLACSIAVSQQEGRAPWWKACGRAVSSLMTVRREVGGPAVRVELAPQ
jgi:hypothetical protein